MRQDKRNGTENAITQNRLFVKKLGNKDFTQQRSHGSSAGST
jgi:hypothetical protein